MESEQIRLDQFLKLMGVVNSGGEAKHLIQNGAVRVNGEVETRRGRKLISSDVVGFGQQDFEVKFGQDEKTV